MQVRLSVYLEYGKIQLRRGNIMGNVWLQVRGKYDIVRYDLIKFKVRYENFFLTATVLMHNHNAMEMAGILQSKNEMKQFITS